MKKRFCRKCFLLSFVALFSLVCAYWASTFVASSQTDLSELQDSLQQATVLPADFPLQILDAVIREAPPTMKVNAGYAKLTNTGNVDITITAVGSDAFSAIMIHSTSVVDGVATMQAQSKLLVPAGASVRLSPGGLHLMLMGANRSLSDGDTVEIALHTSGGTTSAEFRVKRF